MPIEHHDFGLAVSGVDKISMVVAAGMVSLPLWLESVKVVSEVAAIFAPILGCIYLSMQIGFKLWDRAKSED